MNNLNLLGQLTAPTTVGSGDWLASPRRIQLSRKAGWKMPPNTVVVSRPSKWGNVFRISPAAGNTAEQVVKDFERFIADNPKYIAAAQAELHGKNLACWCKVIDADGNYVPCHADILLALANG